MDEAAAGSPAGRVNTPEVVAFLAGPAVAGINGHALPADGARLALP